MAAKLHGVAKTLSGWISHMLRQRSVITQSLNSVLLTRKNKSYRIKLDPIFGKHTEHSRSVVELLVETGN